MTRTEDLCFLIKFNSKISCFRYKLCHECLVTTFEGKDSVYNGCYIVIAIVPASAPKRFVQSVCNFPVSSYL